MLFFLPTPIGNKSDITLRTLEMLKELQIFLCEDTRTAKKLFQMYEIPIKDKHFFVYTSFIDKNKYKKLISEQNVGVLSEAGTPGLSDPGKALIQLCNKHQLAYSILPWSNALIPAVVGAWFDTSIFTFLGFLPAKKGRQTALKDAFNRSHPTFFYESVHRFEKLLNELENLWFQGKISIAREISKLFEQYFTGTLEEAKQLIKSWNLQVKGEFVIWLSPR